MQKNDLEQHRTQERENKTKAEAHWSGPQGDAWMERCSNEKIIASKLALYSKMLSKTKGINSVLEFGPGTGQSLSAVKALLPEVSCCAVEINDKASQLLKSNLPCCDVILGSILDTQPPECYDFVYTSGLLIHITDEFIAMAYDRLYSSSNRYIGIAEYYNPTPVDVMYRGESGILFKRDFAGEMLDRFPDLDLVDYGFVYHRDPNFPQDDVNWFLLEKIAKRSLS